MTKQKYTALTVLCACIFGFYLSSEAQEKTNIKPTQDTAKTKVTEEIEVVRAYKPVLADAVKIRRSPNLNDTKPFNPKMNYNILDKRLALNSGIGDLNAQKLIPQKIEPLQNNYAKLGLGNLGTTLAQLNIATGQDEALQAGINFNHLGMDGTLNQQKISTQDLNAYGKSIGNQLVIEGNLNFNRKSTYFYGIDPENSFANLNPEKQKFNYFGGEGLLFNRTETDDNQLAYAAKINASIFSNAFSAKENNLIFSGSLSKKLTKFDVGVNGLTDFTTSKDANYNLNNNIFKLNPYLKINNEKLALTAGINYVSEFGMNQNTHIFPIANFDLRLIKDYLTVFVDFGGDVDQTKLKNLSDLNPYLNQDIAIKNKIRKFDGAAGLKGTIASSIGFKAMMAYQTVENLAYFVNNVDEPQKFDIAYFTNNTNILDFTGELNITLSNALNLDSKISLKQYKNDLEENAWLLPSVVLNSSATFKINDKLKITGDLLFQGDTKAKILTYRYDGTNPTPVGIDTNIKTIKAFADFSMGASYQYNKKVSAFIKVNNLLGNDYQRYAYYQNYGVNILGGLSYEF